MYDKHSRRPHTVANFSQFLHAGNPQDSWLLYDLAGCTVSATRTNKHQSWHGKESLDSVCTCSLMQVQMSLFQTELKYTQDSLLLESRVNPLSTRNGQVVGGLWEIVHIKILKSNRSAYFSVDIPNQPIHMIFDTKGDIAYMIICAKFWMNLLRVTEFWYHQMCHFSYTTRVSHAYNYWLTICSVKITAEIFTQPIFSWSVMSSLHSSQSARWTACLSTASDFRVTGWWLLYWCNISSCIVGNASPSNRQPLYNEYPFSVMVLTNQHILSQKLPWSGNVLLY